MPESSLDLPDNDSAQGLAAGLRAAFRAYGESALGHPTCVLFLVQDGERNIFDQRHLEYALQADSIPVFRLPFSQILAHTSLNPSSPKRQLLYHPPHNPSRTFEVAVAYLRAGYGPSDYGTPSAWEARYRIERSAAIACPSVLTQLAGMKKVQQVLATPESVSSSPSALRRFVPDDDRFAALWKTFANIYPLDAASPAGQEARRLATDPEECKKYVMKPQREGGGNNFYRTSIPERLQEIPPEHWGTYILMELITPPPFSNIILRNGKLEQGGVISELGIYGTCLWDQQSGRVLHNEEAGYLLRTKGDKSEEGGVAAGFGCMDSCRLV
jgi:glutathione synthase